MLKMVLVNSAIGTLKYIEYLTEDEQVTIYGTTEVDGEPQPSTSTRIRKRVRLWLEFPNPSMGQLCREKAKPHVMCKRDVLDLKWTPIVTRAANIPLGGNIKRRRNQFPVVSASAITIHKSQGGPFDEVVFNYDKSQQIQLVYVALSRVTSINGLYLTNDKDVLKFYHGRGSTAPTVKDIRDEYDRMANHRLPTLSMQARAFCKRDVLAERNEDQGGYLHQRRQLILIVSAFNAQSLVAHAGDIESDNILMNSDYMNVVDDDSLRKVEDMVKANLRITIDEVEEELGIGHELAQKMQSPESFLQGFLKLIKSWTNALMYLALMWKKSYTLSLMSPSMI
ncbi:uncharacterized protein TNCV_2363191 [Trichonephila clavipes]|nr:uncharacterized protein TNCV_2363191 [Trichonephila clavipes]